VTEEQDDLARAFARVADIFHPAESVQETLDHVAELAVDLVDGCSSASVSLARDGTITTTATSGELAIRVDDLQRDTGEGPCLEAIWEDESLLIDDLRDDQRFPAFSPRAVEMGVGSVMAYRLFDHANGGTAVGALNLFGRQPHAFKGRDRSVGCVLAAHVAVALAAAQAHAAALHEAEGLKIALESRDVIGQAKGIIMERERVTAEDAFELLRRASQHLNVKLRDLSQRLVEGGDLPTSP